MKNILVISNSFEDMYHDLNVDLSRDYVVVNYQACFVRINDYTFHYSSGVNLEKLRGNKFNEVKFFSSAHLSKNQYNNLLRFLPSIIHQYGNELKGLDKEIDDINTMGFKL